MLFYHGFGGTKERAAPFLTALAEAGFLAVGLDAVGHGERRFPNFETIFDDERWDTRFEATETDFLQLLDDTVAEVPAIIEHLARRGWAHQARIGVAGRSLGGNPHHHPDRFFPAALLSQSAELDEYVPPEPVKGFHACLAPWYAAEPDRVRYIEYAGVGHFLTPELVVESRQRLVAWFGRWLPNG